MNETDTQQWSEIILPEKRIFDIKLGEIWRYRDLIYLFVKRDLVAQYRQTILGPFWYVIQPIFTTIIYLFIFNGVAKIPTDGLPHIVFYMAGISIWNYFSTCFSNTATTFVSNAGVFGKVYFPRLVSPIAVVISAIIKFLIQFALLLLIMLFYYFKGEMKFDFGFHLLLIPAIIIVMALMGLGCGIIVSSITTKYRDFTILINFGLQLLMYLTPVAYSLSFLMSRGYKNLVSWNPLCALVEGFRYAVFGQGILDTSLFIYSIIFTLISLVAGIILFNKVERNFMDTV